MYKKVSIEEELPPIDEFVTCFYDSGETMVYKRYETGTTKLYGNTPVATINTIEKDWAWTMRDGIADRTPKEGKITHWLKYEEAIPYPIETIDLIYDDEVSVDMGVVIIKTTKKVLRNLLVNYIKQT